MVHERVVQPMADRPLECLVEDAAAAQAVDLLQLGFELAHVSWRPLLHERRIEAAELCNVEEWPRAFGPRRRRSNGELTAQPLAQC